MPLCFPGALALLLLVQAAPAEPSARAAVREALAAVEGDSAVRAAARWAADLKREPADGSAMIGLATLARLTYDYAAADRWYARARRSPNASVVLQAELGQAHGYATRWRRPAADSATLRALALARRMGDGLAESESLILWARLVGRQVGADSALRLVARAAAVLPERERTQAALVKCLEASVLRTTDAARAQTLVEAALPRLESARELRALGTCRLSQASILAVRGSAEASHAALLAAAETFARARDDDSRAGVLQWLAFSAIEQRSAFADGRRYGEEALRLARRSGNILTESWAGLNLAQLALRLGDAKTAARLTGEAAASFARLGDLSGAASVQFVMGDAAWLAGRLDAAQRAYESQGRLIDRLGLVAYRPTQRLRLAGIHRERGDLAGAARLLAEARRLAREAGVPGVELDARYESGLQLLAQQQWSESAAAFARFIADETSPHHRYDARLRRAEALVMGGALAEGEEEIGTALAEFDAWRAQFRDRESQLVMLQSRRFDFDPDLGVARVVERLVRLGREPVAFRLAEAQRARHLYTRVVRRLALGERSGNDPAVRLARLAPPADQAATLRAQLPPGTALLEFITGRGSEPTTLFILTRTGLAAVPLAPADSLAPGIERFATLLEGGARARTLAERLGRALLAPALTHLSRGITRVVVVPDGPLHRLPFGALVLPGGLAALERFEISLAPSARLAATWWQAERASPSAEVLAFGNPNYPPGSGLPHLPGTAAEIRSIARITGATQIRTGADASETELKRASGRELGVLHLATHAEVQDDGLLASALFLSPDGSNDGHIGVEEIAALRLQVGLVVLSACRTGGGALVHGEGVQGLTAPFLEAGARAVAVTHWEVGDRRIVPLMAAFYRELATGATASTALRRARLELARAGASPAIWAGVDLVGDGNVRPLAGGVATGR